MAAITSMDAKNYKSLIGDHREGNKNHLLLSTVQQIEFQKYEPFSTAVLKMINEKKLSSPSRYFVDDQKVTHKVVREDEKSFHALIVLQALTR